MRDGETFYRFIKDDKIKSVTMETSKQLMGPWQDMRSLLGAGQEFGGPHLLSAQSHGNGRPSPWCLLLDDLSGSGARCYMPYVSDDLSTGQLSRLSTDFHFPFPFRHGSVLPITTEERERLKSAYPESQKTSR